MEAANCTATIMGKNEFLKKLEIFTLKNDNQMEVQLLNYGAIISSIKVPDRQGNMDDILLGFKNLEDYEENSVYFGALVGRVANRIENGKFKLDGQTIQLTCNEGPNQLHGGFKGFSKKFWTGTLHDGGKSVSFDLKSPDGDEGYPGELDVNVVYTITDDNQLKITYKAVVTDKATIVNLTSHPYFNLSGTENKCANILDHELQINANNYLPVNKKMIPTGEIRCVARDEGVYDYRQPKLIGKDLDKLESSGMDNTFCKNGDHAFCARVYHAASGRILEVCSSQPGIHIYTPNFTDGTLLGKHGSVYSGRSAFCIENQNYPNAINQHISPVCPILRPGEIYEQFTTLKFSSK
eukprot:gene20190-22166_t